MTAPKKVTELPAADYSTDRKKPDSWFLYFLVDGNLKDKQRKGCKEAADCPTKEDVEMAAINDGLCPPGRYRAERRVGGITKDSFFFTKPEPSFFNQPEPERERIIEIGPEEFEDDPDEYPFPENPSPGMSAAEVENMLLKERLRRFEEDARRQKTGSQSETQALISALEDARREQVKMQHDLTMLMLSQSQKPQQDATLQAMNMLEKSFGMITKAKALSEEIAPSGSGDGDGGYLAGGAKLLDSLGRNAGTFLPLLAGLIPKAAPTPAPASSEVSFPSNGGEFTELAGKIQKKGAVKT